MGVAGVVEEVVAGGGGGGGGEKMWRRGEEEEEERRCGGEEKEEKGRGEVEKRSREEGERRSGSGGRSGGEKKWREKGGTGGIQIFNPTILWRMGYICATELSFLFFIYFAGENLLLGITFFFVWNFENLKKVHPGLCKKKAVQMTTPIAANTYNST